MTSNSRRAINSSLGFRLSTFLAHAVPARYGYHVTNFLADRIASRRTWEMVRAVGANQWVVSGCKLDGAALNAQVRRTFRSTARSIYDLHRFIENPDYVTALVKNNPVVYDLITRSQYEERGMLVVGVHMSNFDLLLQAGFLMGANALVLTVPELLGGYQEQFEMRKRTGMNLVPASLGGLRQAIEHLKKGGWVLTGMDRPVEKATYRPLFFGQPASLPVHYVSLALKARVPLVVTSAIRYEDGSYHFSASDPLEMVPGSSHKEEMLQNAEAALELAEGFILRAPEQWAMSFPVWPEMLDLVPV